MVLLYCLLAIIPIWILYKIVEEKCSPLSKIPVPPGGFPLIGHLLTFAKERNLLSLLLTWSEKYGPVFRYSPGFGFGIGANRVYITDPKLVKQVLLTNFHKYQKPDFVREVVPNLTSGLFTSAGSAHARQRRMVTPAFSPGRLELLMPVMKKETLKLVEIWNLKLNNEITYVKNNVYEDVKHLSLDIIGRVAFGINFNMVSRGDSEVSRAFKELMQGMSYGAIIRRRLIPFYKYLPFPDSIRMRNATRITNDTVMKVIKERRQSQSNRNNKDLLDFLLDMYDEETRSHMDDEELRCQVLTFALAGHETVTATVCWALYELCRHRDVQEKAAQEAMEVFESQSSVTWQHVHSLQYLGQVVKETLRLHPPAFLTHRATVKEDNLAGYTIPKGTFVAIGIDSIHKSDKYWTDPLKFDPQRFTENDDGSAPYKPFTYLPFSGGPRTCIGYKFAMMELKIILAELLRHFRFSAPPGLQAKPLIRLVTRPDPPLELFLEKRVL